MTARWIDPSVIGTCPVCGQDRPHAALFRRTGLVTRWTALFSVAPLALAWIVLMIH